MLPPRDLADRNQIFEVVAEQSCRDVGTLRQLAAQPKFVIPAFLRIHIRTGADAVNHVFGARWREALVHSREQRGCRYRIERHAERRDQLGESIFAGYVVEFVGALALHSFHPQSGRNGEASQQKAVLHERGIGIGLAPVILHHNSVAIERTRCVFLFALLIFKMRAYSGVELGRDTEHIMTKA